MSYEASGDSSEKKIGNLLIWKLRVTDKIDNAYQYRRSRMFKQLRLSKLNHSMYKRVSIYPFKQNVRTLRLLDCGFICIYRKFSIMKLHTILII